MNIEKDINLKPFNTFGIKVTAEKLSRITSVTQAQNFFSDKGFKNSEHFILGGGSNILFTSDVKGIVIKNEIKGIEVVNEDVDHFYVKAGAGENWHQFVLYCIERGYAGIENLSFIPGNVGASPMQNIGAYGVELKDIFHSLEGLHTETNEIKTFNNSECEFGYRESIFKKKYKNQFLILSVTLKLRKIPNYNISYGAIANELEAMNVKELSIKAISDAVINIRRSKLPDPAVIGNAGSFFKNPVVDSSLFNQLKERHPDLVAYPSENGMKLAAGWLIEKCGWKGKAFGDAGVHKNQALVLVNYGNANGHEIYDLSAKIIESVKETFGVELEREVNIY